MGGKSQCVTRELKITKALVCINTMYKIPRMNIPFLPRNFNRK
jgi:hypothetical protein